jgi:hypothetical protein
LKSVTEKLEDKLRKLGNIIGGCFINDRSRGMFYVDVKTEREREREKAGEANSEFTRAQVINDDGSS